MYVSLHALGLIEFKETFVFFSILSDVGESDTQQLKGWGDVPHGWAHQHGPVGSDRKLGPRGR